RAGALPERLRALLARVGDADALAKDTQFGSAIFANRPGDGSAREQAASCQKVLGALANVCREYATKRYRSNCINWGMLPFTIDKEIPFTYVAGDCIFVPEIRQAVAEGREDIPATVLRQDGTAEELTLHIRGLTEDEKEILLRGCLMNYYAARQK
ncbi:MAG: hydratase, partial [Oscillospiraceae bacterium]|nr:hydratase [Oscillospiraceae bacterium]